MPCIFFKMGFAKENLRGGEEWDVVRQEAQGRGGISGP